MKVVVQTYNSPENIDALTDSLEHIDHDLSLLVVDDSSEETLAEQTRTATLECEYDSDYVGAREFEEYREALKNQYPEISGKETVEELELGREMWDVPSPKRAKELIAYSEFSNEYYLFLDGDYRATPETSISTDHGQPLAAMEVCGSFDLHRAQWIFVCNRLAEMVSPELSEGDLDSRIDRAFKNDYVTNIVRELSPAELRTAVGRYTTLLPDPDDADTIQFPNRGYLSGGAYGCFKEALGIGYYPSWYGDDGTWFPYVVKKLGMGRPVTDTVLRHDPEEKDIIDENGIKREAVGTLYFVASERYIRRGELDLEKLEELLTARIERLEHEEQRASMASKVLGSDKDFETAISWAIEATEELSPERIRQRVREYDERQEQWEQVTGAISQGSPVYLD